MDIMNASAMIGRAQDAYSIGAQSQVARNAQSAQNNLGAKGVDEKSAKGAAENFESFFVGQMLEYMWEGVEVDPMFGGGHAEEMWRSMLNQEYGKHVAKSGGVGIANNVMTSMLRAQEERTMAEQKLSGRTSGSDGGDASATAGAVSAAAQIRR
jgi:peptidoglycan hydrolase FlgJ